MMGFGMGMPEDIPPVQSPPAQVQQADSFGTVPLEQLIKWKYDYADDPKKRAKIDRAVELLSPLYGSILGEYGIEPPTEPFEVDLMQNPYKDAMNSALNPEVNMRAFYRHGEPRRVYLNDSFFDWDDDGDEPRTVTLGHELVHNMGLSRHTQHPRAKKGMTDTELSQMFSADVRRIFRDAKKKREKEEKERKKQGSFGIPADR